MGAFKMALFLLSIAYTVETQRSDRDVRTYFLRFKIVPDVLSTPPTRLVEVYYKRTARVNLGDELAISSVAVEPIYVRWRANPNLYYTLAMVDPDALARSFPVLRNYKHWLIGNIRGNKLKTGTTLSSYATPTPTPASGGHRYTYLIFLQRSGYMNFDVNPIEKFVDRINFNVNEFARKYNLQIYAGNFFQSRILPVKLV